MGYLLLEYVLTVFGNFTSLTVWWGIFSSSDLNDFAILLYRLLLSIALLGISLKENIGIIC